MPAVEPGTVHFELAAVRARHEGTNDDRVIRGEREESGIQRPVMGAAQGETIARIVGAVLVLRHDVYRLHIMQSVHHEYTRISMNEKRGGP